MLSKKSLQQEELVKFHALLEKAIIDLEYGTMSVNVILSEGIPKIDSLNIVSQKRIKYPEIPNISVKSAVIIDKMSII